MKNSLERSLTLAAAVAACALGTSGAHAVDLELLGRYGQIPQNLEDEDPGNDIDYFDGSAAEIPTYDPATHRIFVTNAVTASIDVIGIADPANPTLLFSIPLGGEGITGPSSAVFTGGVLAVSLVADPKTDNGTVAFFDADGNVLAPPVTVGALPDAIAVTPDGTKLVTSNEGEPNAENTVDPEGSVSIIDISSGVAAASVTTATFGAFDAQADALKAAGVRIFGRLFEDTGEVDEDGEPVFDEVGPTRVAQDLEPEYAAISPDSTKAFVTLQENNALAVVDLVGGTVTDILPLGLKDHSLTENALDPSDRDNFPGKIGENKVLGMYLPDAIAAYEASGEVYLVTANEGDSRDYDNFSEEIRGADLPDEGFRFKGGNGLIKNNKRLGRLKTTIAPPQTAIVGYDKSGTAILDNVVSYGARSFSIWSASTGQLVFDSGDDFERITLLGVPDVFNASNDDAEPDTRSDDKGPEPEGVTVAGLDGKTYAFITLERVGGVMVYDVSDPVAPVFVDYENTRRFEGEPGALSVEDDLGPESLVFIAPTDSPTGQALLVVTNEVSGSTLVFRVNP